jgi:hypothetical protein
MGGGSNGGGEGNARAAQDMMQGLFKRKK